MDGLGIVNHEGIGEFFLLKHGFSPEVAQLVASHVQAKRYLAYRTPGYVSRLSPASLGTLRFQGGPMTESEAKDFELDPLFKDIIQVRKFDEVAKVPDLQVAPLESYREMIRRHVAARRL
jgi:predicted HD phosphohydrolase